ncbi:MAG: hypothetical protein E7033_07080 [Akkermansiaceae bacterium]|nr:hypothetical protein [Akkermansiaceae bacterium]
MKRLLPLVLFSLFPSALSADEAADALIQQQIELMHGISNKEQADVAAPLLAGFELPDNASDTAIEGYQAACDALPYHYYGSAQLAIAMGVDEEDAAQCAQLPVPVTPQISAELAERMQRSFALLPPSIRKGVSGGPGFTRETAWVCTAPRPADTEFEDKSTFFCPEALLGNSTLISQESKEIEGKHYVGSTIAVFHRGQKYEITVWLDTTAAPVYTEDLAEYGPSAEELDTATLCCNQRKLAILQGVKDRAAADAAADELEDLSATAHSTTASEQILDACEPIYELCHAEEESLAQQHYYGSTLLATHCGDPWGTYERRELTPETAQKIAAIMQTALHNSPYKQHKGILGGPGFTQDTARRIPAAACIDCIQNPAMDRTDAINALTHNLLAPVSIIECEDITGPGVQNGRYYEIHHMRALLEGKVYHYDIWLDYSDGRLIPSDAELRDNEKQYTQALAARLELLRSVKDRATADAAAAHYQEAQVPELLPYKPLFPTDTPPAYKEIQAQLHTVKNELREQNCYQSTALKLLLRYPKDGFTDAERHQAQAAHEQECLAYIQLLQQVLPTVTDHATAMAAARTLRAHGGNTRYSHLSLLRAPDLKDKTDTATPLHLLHCIRQEGYYGSVDLAGILEERIGPSGHPSLLQQYDPAETALQLLDTAWALSEVEQMLRSNLQRSPYDLHHKISGGPGFTKETAWQIPLEMNMLWPSPNAEGYDNAANMFDDILFKGINTYGETRSGVLDGRYYEVHPSCVQIDGTEFICDVWIDCTAGYDVRTDEENKAAMADFEQKMSQRLELMSTIHNRETADAAAEKLHQMGHFTLPQEHQTPLCLKPTQDDNLSEKSLAEYNRLLAEDYFGSRSLFFYFTHPSVLVQPSYADKVSPEEKQALKARQFQRTQQFVQLLEQELPLVNNQATAMAAARSIAQCCHEFLYLDDFYDFHEYNNSAEIPCDWQALRTHVQRIVKADYYGSVDLADILIKVEFHFLYD